MIISDGIHVTSTSSIEELHRWAAIHGISRRRYHGLKKGHPHYDLPLYLATAAFQRDLKQVTGRDVLAAAKAIASKQD